MKKYDIVNEITDTKNYEYEEITVREFLNTICPKEERNNFIRQMFAVNMHYLLSEETYDRAFSVIDDISSDKELEGFNAIVFLQYKHKNKTSSFHSVLDVSKYTKLINYCKEKKVRYGFDSCSCPMFIESIKNDIDKNQMEMLSEPCESGLMSSYINCKGEFFVCSFAEGEGEWTKGINVLECDNFVDDVWNNERVIEWREKLIGNKRSCPIYNLVPSVQKV